MFLDANLPTLLAPGNLPAFASNVDFEYIVYTTPSDAKRMMRSPAFQRLRSLAKVKINLFTPSSTANPVGLHHSVWGDAIQRARRHGSFILLMPPDVVWANGTFARLAEVLRAGKHAIFATYPRVVSDTLVPAMLDRFQSGVDLVVAVPPTEMMALGLTHIHPLMAAYMRSESHFPIHPEMVIWPVAGDGFLLRLLARELFCFEPGRYELNAQSLLASMPPADDIHVFRDAREFLGLSLTPLWKDMEWYLRPNRLDPLFVGRWWITYDSPLNNYLSTCDLRFGCGRADEARWRRRSQQADALVTHLKIAREFVRIVLGLQQAGCGRAAAYLAAALRVHGIARRWPHRGSFLVFAPRDAAFETPAVVRYPGDRTRCGDVLAILKAHVAPIPPGQAIEDDLEVKTLNGRPIRLADTAQTEPCGDNFILPVREMI